MLCLYSESAVFGLICFAVLLVSTAAISRYVLVMIPLLPLDPPIPQVCHPALPFASLSVRMDTARQHPFHQCAPISISGRVYCASTLLFPRKFPAPGRCLAFGAAKISRHRSGIDLWNWASPGLRQHLPPGITPARPVMGWLPL